MSGSTPSSRIKIRAKQSGPKKSSARRSSHQFAGYQRSLRQPHQESSVRRGRHPKSDRIVLQQISGGEHQSGHLDQSLTDAGAYRFSYWDSLIVSSALTEGATLIYSEDMQNGLKVENQLRIINPFADSDGAV